MLDKIIEFDKRIKSISITFTGDYAIAVILFLAQYFLIAIRRIL